MKQRLVGVQRNVVCKFVYKLVLLQQKTLHPARLKPTAFWSVVWPSYRCARTTKVCALEVPRKKVNAEKSWIGSLVCKGRQVFKSRPTSKEVIWSWYEIDSTPFYFHSRSSNYFWLKGLLIFRRKTIDRNLGFHRLAKWLNKYVHLALDDTPTALIKAVRFIIFRLFIGGADLKPFAVRGKFQRLKKLSLKCLIISMPAMLYP